MSTLPTPTVRYFLNIGLQQYPISELRLTRALHPREDFLQAKLPGLINLGNARDIILTRADPDASNPSSVNIIWRGVLTRLRWEMALSGYITWVEARGLWFILEKRMVKQYGATPPGYPANPYVTVIPKQPPSALSNVLLEIMSMSFQDTAGPLPPIGLGDISDFANNIVNYQMQIKYQTVAEVLEQAVQGAALQAEYRINFTTSTPMLDIKRFNPPYQLGVGTDKSANVNFIEGETIMRLTYEQDFESMANRLIASGAATEIGNVVPVGVESPDSISQYGLQEQQFSLGSVVTSSEIMNYLNNTLYWIQRPIPRIQVYLGYPSQLTQSAGGRLLNPGDVVSLTLRNMSAIFNAGTITARIIQLQLQYDVSTGEQYIIDMTYPVSRGGMTVGAWATRSLESIVGGIQRQIGQLATGPSGGLIQQVPWSTKVTVADLVTALSVTQTGAILASVQGAAVVPISITADLSQYLSQAQVAINSNTPGVSNVLLSVVGPGGKVYSFSTSVGQVIDISDIIKKFSAGTYYFLVQNALVPQLAEYNVNVNLLFRNTQQDVIIADKYGTGAIIVSRSALSGI